MGTSLHELDFKTLAILDEGKNNAQLASRLSTVSKDCQDRPGDLKARTVLIRITFEPVPDPDGGATKTNMFVDIDSKLPAYKSTPYSVGMRRKRDQGTFVFNENSLDNVDQGTLDYEDDE